MTLLLVALFTMSAAVAAGPETTGSYSQPAPSSMPTALDDTPGVDASELGSFFNLLESEVTTSTASKTAVSAADAPAIITVIPRATIELRGFRSIADVLRYVPGLYVVDDGLTSNVGVRGINGGPDSYSRIIKVLVDGRPINVTVLGGTLIGLETIPIDAVEAVEVIRGPASALYGANAFLGVVNIITRIPEESSARLTGETSIANSRVSGRGDAWMGVVGPGENPMRLVLSVSHGRYNRGGRSLQPTTPIAESFGSRESANDISQPMSAFARGILPMGRFGELSLMALYQQMDSHAEFSEVSVLTHHNRFAMQNLVARIDHTAQFRLGGGVLKTKLTGSAIVGKDLARQMIDTGAPGFILRRERSGRSIQEAAEVSYTHGEQFALVGIDYEDILSRGDVLYQEATDPSRNARGDQTLRSRDPRFRYGDLGIYGQIVVRPGMGFTLTGGARFDHIGRFEDRFNSRVAISKRFGDLTAKVLYGTSFVPPSPSQLTGASLPGAVQSNPTLRPQAARTVEAAVIYTFGSIASVQASLFQTHVEDRIENIPVSLNLTASNLTNSDSVGGEISGDLKLEPFFAQANASYVHSSVATPSPRPFYWSSLYGDRNGAFDPSLPSFPALVSHGTVGVSFPEWWIEGNLTVNVATARRSSFSNAYVANGPYNLGSYATFDVFIRSLELTFLDDRKAEVALAVTNIMNTKYSEPGGSNIDIPQAPRTGYLRLSIML